MQPSSEDPTNATGQPSSSFPSEQSSVPPQQDSMSPAGQPSPYPQTGPQFAPPPPLTSPQGSYPPGEEAYYRQRSQDGGPITQYQAGTQGKLNVPPVTPNPRNGWKVATFALLILVVILATATTTLVLTHSTGQQIVQTTPVSTTTQPVLQATPTATPATGATATPSGPVTSYNAPQPGPGCDPNGGTWAPYPTGAISNIQCGTTITVGGDQTRGYLGLQLPSNTACAATNRIEVTSSLGTGGASGAIVCGGLAEQDANNGYLVEICSNGQWSIYSIASSGSVVKTLTTSVTSTRNQATIQLTLKGSTLTFTIDSEIHTLTITPIQPVKVAIAVYSNNETRVITVNNFSYITQF